MNPGARIGGCVIEARLGAGGMGAVYRARDAAGAPRALKVLTGDGGAQGVERFQREAAALAAVGEHPNLVRVHGAGRDGGHIYIIMSLCPGGDLARRLKGGPLEAREAATIALGVARGLAQAHARGVLHRDLKPANVLFDEEGRPRLTDFGLARVAGAGALTRTGDALGTPEYMAPEQADGKAADARTDVYGLGAILFACLAGHAPHAASSPAAVLKKALLDDPAWPEVDPALLAVLKRAMARDRVNRYPTVEAFAEALQGWLRGESPESARRSRGGPLLAGASLIALVAAGLTHWTVSRDAPTPPVATSPRVSRSPELPSETSRPMDATPTPRTGRVCDVSEGLGHTYGWFLGPTLALRVTEFAPGGQRPPSEVTTWDLAARRPADSISLPTDATWSRVISAAISPDRKKLALGGSGDGRALVLDVDGWRPTWLPAVAGGEVHALAFSPTRPHLAIGAVGGRVLIVDTTTNAEVAQDQVLHESARVDALAFDRERLFVGGSASETTKLFVAIVDPTTLEVKARTRPESGLSDVTALVGRPQGGAVVGTIRHTIHLLEPDGGLSEPLLGHGLDTMLGQAHGYEIRWLEWTRSGRLASVSGARGWGTADKPGELRVWSMADRPSQLGATHSAGRDHQYGCIDVSPEHGFVLLGSNDGRLEVLKPP